ncbi:glycoside hydrolase family 16 protein, partial [Streptomyces sp. SID5789]|nr:glycoside hydrolase family 16 protein [Streptomyces sp. SID5789]
MVRPRLLRRCLLAAALSAGLAASLVSGPAQAEPAPRAAA